jgi:predicted metallopeptidase
MARTPRPRKKKYLNNADLLVQIHQSKKTFCYYDDMKYSDYTAILPYSEITAEKVEELAGDGLVSDVVIRVMTHEHVPEAVKNASRAKGQAGKAKTNFPPFKHYIWDNGPVEVARSHWSDGEFSIDHGRLTEEMGKMIWTLCLEYSRKGNWAGYSYIDEMRLDAVAHLCRFGLMFNEAASSNPFAYLTTCVSNSFLRTLAAEKLQVRVHEEVKRSSGIVDKVSWQEVDIRRSLGEKDEYVVPKAGRPAGSKDTKQRALRKKPSET